ncbi:hypothetical protein Q5692_06835 [Microcoleus sp. C2C3]|uniref:hypothetical protein n=1 Tax=unclassified Microcoleus TaxID=2642155 RepID=UPI002FCFA972
MVPQLILAIADRAQSQRSTARALYIKSVSIGIIPISLLDLCVNLRQSIVICGPRISLF